MSVQNRVWLCSLLLRKTEGWASAFCETLRLDHWPSVFYTDGDSKERFSLFYHLGNG